MYSASSSGDTSTRDFGAEDRCPTHGMVAVCGRRREMEDAVAAVPSFLSLPCDKVGCNCEHASSSSCHFFGVYDGHGGAQAAQYCADRLHHALAEEMEAVVNANVLAEEMEVGVDTSSSDDPGVAPENRDEQWEQAMAACFLRMDAEIGGFCWKGAQCGVPEGTVKCCGEPIAPETMGSTAVVAVVSSGRLIIANCGDSRAVLSRGGQAIPLSVDHKPDRDDELARIEAAGGRVICWDGHRVLGVLAMSRAIGDRYLKPYIIPDPEVTCTQRTEEDECLVLASDGLWDVLSNQAACDVARKCLAGHRHRRGHANPPEEPRPPSSSSCNVEPDETPAARAAALLTKLALARGSTDNVSVVVVDLMTRAKR